uniref:Ig-like domain-containing protein n=1 Tax=Scleropages formosus TaxID=113540 RepID=A0A8C9R2U3_SCLFO
MTQTDGVLQGNPLLEGLPRGNVTLTCTFSKDETDYIFWYKQTLGKEPHVILKSHLALGVLYSFNPKRYKVQAQQGNNHLIILSSEPSDSALYYCGILKDRGILFGAGTFLRIKEQQSSSRTVVQQPVSDPVHPGDSVTLQCTVDSETSAGEHSVYWFRHGSGESLPGLIYTHGNRSDECEKSPEAGSPTHSCVYSLPKRNLRRSDAGIYYCAVLTCGDILFGNGTQLGIKGEKFIFTFIKT